MQQAAIRELSTPIIEVWAGVLCLPVVGIVDSQRSAEMTETLLETIVAKQARTAIVDITGIDVMDTKTADHFIKMAKAVRLLGADCIISGINPGIAQTLTHIGVDLTGVRTMRNLRDALQFHLRETEQLAQPTRRRNTSDQRQGGGWRLALIPATGGTRADPAPPPRGAHLPGARHGTTCSIAPKRARARACSSGSAPKRSTEIAIAVSELATNIVKYGIRGEITLILDRRRAPAASIRVVARDVGPPIRNLEVALQDGYDDRGPIDPALVLRRGGLGTGLGAVLRLADLFEYQQGETGKAIIVTFYR